MSDSPNAAARKAGLTKKLAELARSPHLPPALPALIAEVVRLQEEARETISFNQDNVLAATPAPSTQARLGGAVILQRSAFPFDVAAARRLADSIMTGLAETVADLRAGIIAAQAVLDKDEKNFSAACAAVVEENAEYFAAWAEKHPETPGLLRFIVQSALMPQAQALGEALAPLHNAEVVWSHGHCPICGSLPLMGRLKDSEGKRMHTCSFCAFEYRVPRLACPFCLDERPEGAEQYTSEEEPGYHIATCASCSTYFKLADFRQFDRPFLASLDDPASLVLDLAARQMGLTRPTLSAWGF